MTELDLILLGLTALAAVAGVLRGTRPLDRQMLWLVGVPAVSALTCFLIGANATGSELAGLTGMIAGFILLCMTGGVLLGGVVGLILRRRRGWFVRPASRWQRVLDWTVIYGLAALGVMLSVREYAVGGADGHY